jgi:hypothetical protein
MIFIKQYDRGDGDYTAERWERLDSLSYDEVLAGIRSVENKNGRRPEPMSECRQTRVCSFSDKVNPPIS